jgi:hypothetical protein
LEIHGFGMTNTPENLKDRAEGVAQVWDLLGRGELSLEVVRVPLSEIEEAWTREEHGRRIVVVPQG